MTPVILRGRCSIWRRWRMSPVAPRIVYVSYAPRIVTDVSYTDITHESHSAWQVQYLVTLEGESCCSAHCK